MEQGWQISNKDMETSAAKFIKGNRQEQSMNEDQDQADKCISRSLNN